MKENSPIWAKAAPTSAAVSAEARIARRISRVVNPVPTRIATSVAAISTGIRIRLTGSNNMPTETKEQDREHLLDRENLGGCRVTEIALPEHHPSEEGPKRK